MGPKGHHNSTGRQSQALRVLKYFIVNSRSIGFAGPILYIIHLIYIIHSKCSLYLIWGSLRQPATRYIGFLGRFWFQMIHIVHRAHPPLICWSRRKKNRWEPIVSAMSKKKLHTYCVFETPNRWEPIVVTGQFAFLHTLQYFWEVIFPFCNTL